MNVVTGAGKEGKPQRSLTFLSKGIRMNRRTTFSVFAFCICMAFLAGCQATRSSIKEGITDRSIERARLHDAVELKDAYDAAAGDSDEVLLLFMNSLLLIEEDQVAGYAAAAYMSRPNDQWQDPDGPTGVKPSQMASEGLGRVAKSPEVVRSYTGGAGSGYTMADPENIELTIKETRDTSDDSVKYFIRSAGKDNPSPVAMRRENGKWYIDEWSSIQGGVR